MKIKALIVDDEPISIKHLEMILSNHASEIELVGSAKNVDDALEKILLLKPNLVFLDIELGGESGFDLLKKCPNKKFEVIFVTAHNQFGIEAVKAHAMDYILKPINKIELLVSIENVIEKLQKTNQTHSINANTRISLSTMEGLTLIDLTDIIFIESDGRYSRFYLVNNQKIFVSKNIGKFENELPSNKFIRIHHGTIVNVAYIDKYVRGRGGYVILKNGQSLEVSNRKKDDLLSILE